MLTLKNVSSGYPKKQVLEDVSVCFEKGKLTTIVGPNGCGKSTLLKTILGIVKTSKGAITLDGVTMADMTPRAVAKKISYLSQGRTVPDMTVEQMVLHGRFAHLDYPRIYKSHDRETAFSKMKQMGIEQLADTPVSHLSGGMRQNAYIAMALAQDTDYILLDEPTTYLDIANRLQLMEILKTLAGEGKGIVAVLHDLTLALQYSDKVSVMQNGKILLSDTSQNICNSGVVSDVFGVKLEKIENKNGVFYYYAK